MPLQEEKKSCMHRQCLHTLNPVFYYPWYGSEGGGEGAVEEEREELLKSPEIRIRD